MANITSTSKGVRVSMAAPTLERRPKTGFDGQTIPMLYEMTRISIREKRLLDHQFGYYLDQLIRRMNGTEVRRAA
jgi:hypothetical protein